MPVIEIGEGRRVRRLVTLGSPYYTNRLPEQELAIFAPHDPLVPAPHRIYGPHGRIRVVPEVTSAFSTTRPCSARLPAT